MVNAVCEPAELMPRALEIARTHLRATRRSRCARPRRRSTTGCRSTSTTGLLLEVQAYERMISTEDRHEGVDAFNEKRPPEFKGR